MNILVTGNRGYVGSILAKLLIEKGYNVTGLDANFYKECNFDEEELGIKQIDKDIRNISKDDLKNIDAVIHLAALSNDPLGEFDPDLTYDINYRSTVKLAKYARTRCR